MNSNLESLAQQLSTHGNAPVPPEARQQVEQIVQQAPPQALSAGLQDAFNSDQTPPFAQMVGQLFGHANEQQKSGILGALLGGLGGASHPVVQQAGIDPNAPARATPQQVEQIAQQAQQQNPGIVGQMSQFYAQHPTLVKSLGGMALAVMLGRMHGSTRH
ncbi:hypothetical protein DWG18_07750 [Lysobacter sp. TY2-98]|uniref:hypothetical protein n=1 Tax=Lysobacter sp. TY2-98 TaxID=2290922 RepID=UPI000E206E30|nr:hypothetical protein [Lysobacter sp. TY2-98]AXK72186.1 hypothetical protein DWG18_07750 [Lysobacter sp. TY2-98]